jgi:predicted O-linked N-acetylglucosamine transferase (SPINDLY family)
LEKGGFWVVRGNFVFYSFNQGYKIEPVMFDRWIKILRQVPGSILWLQVENETTEMNLKGKAEKRGGVLQGSFSREGYPKRSTWGA